MGRPRWRARPAARLRASRSSFHTTSVSPTRRRSRHSRAVAPTARTSIAGATSTTLAANRASQDRSTAEITLTCSWQERSPRTVIASAGRLHGTNKSRAGSPPVSAANGSSPGRGAGLRARARGRRRRGQARLARAAGRVPPSVSGATTTGPALGIAPSVARGTGRAAPGAAVVRRRCRRGRGCRFQLLRIWSARFYW